MSTSLKNKAGKTPPAPQKKNSFNLWEIQNGGGGWVHPFHLHMEEHRTVVRNGKVVTAAGSDPAHPDDVSREDLVALDPGESVIVYRGFRDFVGPYVAHCHNLAHEDHAMMFGWEITPYLPIPIVREPQRPPVRSPGAGDVAEMSGSSCLPNQSPNARLCTVGWPSPGRWCAGR